VEAVNSLVNFWRKIPLDGPPYIHTEDKEALEAEGLANYFDCSTDTFESFVIGERFGNFEDNRFQNGLLPQPHMGFLGTADIVI